MFRRVTASPPHGTTNLSAAPLPNMRLIKPGTYTSRVDWFGEGGGCTTGADSFTVRLFAMIVHCRILNPASPSGLYGPAGGGCSLRCPAAQSCPTTRTGMLLAVPVPSPVVAAPQQ